jgi:hypothetical protein
VRAGIFSRRRRQIGHRGRVGVTGDEGFEHRPPGDAGDAPKAGVRPDHPDPFEAITTWAVDACDLTSESRAEVHARAQQVLRMCEPVLVDQFEIV